MGERNEEENIKRIRVCACNVTNLELMTINSYFNSNAPIQLKLKST